MPHAWIIDVCTYCGAHAKWPGCEHWQSHEGWSTPVMVMPSPAHAHRLDQLIAERKKAPPLD